MARESKLEVRCNDDELEIYTRSAQLEGDTLSGWVRRALMREALLRLGPLLLQDIRQRRRGVRRERAD